MFSFLFQYELLFSVHDEHDPAIMVVQKLIERYPKVDAKLFIGKLLQLCTARTAWSDLVIRSKTSLITESDRRLFRSFSVNVLPS